MVFDPRNILIINFGQLGDVILSLAALQAISERFPESRKSIVVGSACAEIVKMTNLFDEVIPVDRVLLRKSNKVWSSIQILKFTYRIRRERFDLVIDLHSLPETNLLGYISGARHRLFANRESRSIDSLSNFRPKPPIEDKEIHASLGYLRVLEPLSISGSSERYGLKTAVEDLDYIRGLMGKLDGVVVGLNPGAGHPSRRWSLEKFLELANKLSKLSGVRVAIFLGPEERELKHSIASDIDKSCILFDGLSLPQLGAAVSIVDVLVSNDTGPAHLASVAGTPILLLLSDAAPDRYLPRSSELTVLRRPDINDITAEDVYEAVLAVIDPKPQG